ncbi:MAG TPA: ribose-5-phosphate isomerase RpiA [Sphingobium sp.]|uniref:ribose-5-phosphate isomerase RpiA n=1 Tax=Sphingobium sp. TaxID=1912891 RepID=UPI002ED00F0C
MNTILAQLDDRKRAAAEAAVAEISEGMLVGLGTGSTAAFAIEALARRVAQGLNCRAVATSVQTARHATMVGIQLLKLEDSAEVDLCIDGVDEIDGELRALKGAGGAMLREKIVASAARRMVAIADASKAVARLGARPVPVEVLPEGRAFVARQLGLLDCTPVLRLGDQGKPVRTDQGNIIFDCQFNRHGNLKRTAGLLSNIPGVLGHGLFLLEIDALYLGTADGVVRTERPVSPKL